MVMIPKVIHYCWFGGKPLPYDTKKCIESWKKFCPDYEIKEWNETNFDISCHPFVEGAYGAKAWAFVSDYARLKVIYENGGIYLDTDVELIRNPDFLLENECYIGVQQNKLLCTTGLGFGACKGNSIVYKMLQMYDDLLYVPEKKGEFACPWLNNAVFEKLGYQYTNKVVKMENVTIFPACYFDPLCPGDSNNLLCKDTVSIHHYAASWTSKRNRFKRKLFRLIGEDKVLKLKNYLHINRG